MRHRRSAGVPWRLPGTPDGIDPVRPRVAYDHARRRPKTRILGVTACDEATAFRDDGRVVAIVAHSSSHAPTQPVRLDELPRMACRPCALGGLIHEYRQVA